MDIPFRTLLWNQFGASIDMLENALAACPDELWDTASKFWYTGFHTLFFLDYYLSDDPEKFSPPQSFTLSELDPAGVMPGCVYTKPELLGYLSFCRKKCHDLIAGLITNDLMMRGVPHKKDYNQLELLLYNMRHVQHHAAQLNLLLRQGNYDPPDWVSRTKAIL